MWHELPNQQLAYINARHAQLAAESAESAEARLSSRTADLRTVHGEPGFQGLHIHLGALLIVVGRTLRDEESLRHNAAHP